MGEGSESLVDDGTEKRRRRIGDEREREQFVWIERDSGMASMADVRE
jgi:hypothetical protein